MKIAANMKRTWVGYGLPRDWMDREQGEGMSSYTRRRR